MNRFRFGVFAASCFGLAVTMGMTACSAEEPTPTAKDQKAAEAPAAKDSAVPAPSEQKVAAAEPAAAPAPAPSEAAKDTAPAPAVKVAAAEDDKSAVPDPAFEKQFQEGKKFEGGKWLLPDGSPTYDVKRDPANTDIVTQVDWNTYSGWRRYHAECHVCHGPNAEGSTYAPALKDSLKTMTYEKFLQVVASGQERDVGGTKFIMPALGDNKNVMCYVDDLYIYLRARSTDALPGGRLSADQRAEKPKEAVEYEKACVGD